MRVFSGGVFVVALAFECCAAAEDGASDIGSRIFEDMQKIAAEDGASDIGSRIFEDMQKIAAEYFADVQRSTGLSPADSNFFKTLQAPSKKNVDVRRHMYDVLSSYMRTLKAENGPEHFDPMAKIMPIAFEHQEQRAELYSKMKEMASGLDGSVTVEEAAARRRGLRKLLGELKKCEQEARVKGVAAITDPKYPNFVSEELKEVLVNAFLTGMDGGDPFFKEMAQLAEEN